MTDSQKTFRVLSIDGGGMRGLYTATYLDALAKRYAITRKSGALDIGKGFDLIVGTSTGGIIACALAAGIQLDKVSHLYTKHGPQIFPRKLPQDIGALLVNGTKWSSFIHEGNQALKNALTEAFGDLKVIDIYTDRGISLAVPAVEMTKHGSWVFKTPHLKNSKHRDDHYKLADICLATSAAPIYRSLAAIDNPDTAGYRVFCDGGLWANTPILVGLIDALEMTSQGDKIEVYCLGTCPRPSGEHISKDDVDRGLLGWRFGGYAVSLSLDAQEFAFRNMARMLTSHLNRQVDIITFPCETPAADIMQYLDLDETRQAGLDALINQANRDVDITLSACGNTNDREGQFLDNLFLSLPEMVKSHVTASR